MPELPDITVYIEALEARILGRELLDIEISNPFLLRSAEPPIDEARGRSVVALQRIGKRIAIGLSDELWLIIHLMIAGRLHWYDGQVPKRSRRVAASFRFDNGTLVLTEAGTKKRAALHLVDGACQLREHDPGGLEVMSATHAQFAEALTRSNHTVKRALTDPRILSGIGNAYSDEILHRARLSPVALTQKLTPDQLERLHAALTAVLGDWTEKLRAASEGQFPEKVTAFREGMAVHGRYGQPCPDCGTLIQRIRYASNETNYCPRCQTGGKLLADRSLSRLLRKDWPRTIDELENRSRTR